MKYLFFFLYVWVIGQYLFAKPQKSYGSPRGRNFYKISAFTNIILGFGGLIAVNTLLRDKNIIPQSFVWIGIIGFILILLYGLFCVVKWMCSIEP
jgi:hypothetical protein